MATFRVFVSHTSDMARVPAGRSFVDAVLDGVNRAGMAPVDMRYFAARDRASAQYCQEQVRQCEIYVAVIGFRYGSLVPGEPVSYTEMEFDEATAAGLPRLVFLLADVAELPEEMVDADRRLVEGFRRKLLGAGLLVREFASDQGLELEVFHALREVADGLAPTTAVAALGVTYSLPPDAAGFTGRDEELQIITGGPAALGRPGGVVVVGGMPGAGKTALAVHAAHLLRGRFPDRQLFVDLCAHTPRREPANPGAVLAGLLIAVGVDPRYVPPDADGRSALWRSRMAGRRALLVLDNADSSDQVRPVLPGGDDCLVLVTSRRHLGDLPGAVLIKLGALTLEESIAMFLELAPRAKAEPAATVENLARLAGFLPLAVSLLARVYARHPSWTISDLARETSAGLLTITPEKDSVAGAFDLSYHSLADDQKHLFRLLGVHPGTTIDGYAAAALNASGVQAATALLEILHGEGLLAEVGYRRYGMHDLIRMYARDIADPAGDRRAALARSLDYYQNAAALAGARMAGHDYSRLGEAVCVTPHVLPDLPDRERALVWTRTECANLLACLDWLAETGQHGPVVALTASVAVVLRHDGLWEEAVARHGIAVRAAEHAGDRPGQAAALRNLGEMRRLTGDYAGSAEALQDSVSIFAELGDRLGQAAALVALGMTRQYTGDVPGAAQALESALALFRDARDRLGEAEALTELGAVRRLAGHWAASIEALESALSIYREAENWEGRSDNAEKIAADQANPGIGDTGNPARALLNLGVVQWLMGDYPAATGALEQALTLFRDTGSRIGEASALRSLGAVRWLTGDFIGATGVLEQAHIICRELGDRHGQATALNDLGVVRRLTGDYPGAGQVLTTALDIYREIGYPGGEGTALNEMAAVQILAGDYAGAGQALDGALRIARDIGSLVDEANVLGNLGTLLRLTGDHTAATQALGSALRIYRQLGERGGEVTVLNEAGTLHLADREVSRARESHQLALDHARDIGSAWDEAQALAGLGRCAAADGDVPQARSSLRQALDILQQIGAADASDIAGDLDNITGTCPQ